MGSFAYGNANKQKLYTHEGFGTTFTPKCCESFYHTRSDMYSSTRTNCNGKFWITFGCVHTNAMTYAFIAFICVRVCVPLFACI